MIMIDICILLKENDAILLQKYTDYNRFISRISLISIFNKFPRVDSLTNADPVTTYFSGFIWIGKQFWTLSAKECLVNNITMIWTNGRKWTKIN